MKRIEKISAPNPIPIKRARKLPLPAWYLPNGTINATENQLEISSSSCERWGMGCAGVVIISVIAELVIAHIRPPYDLFLTDSAIADAGIALGIVGEVLFGMWNNRIQTELRSRSNKRLADAMTTAGEANERAEKLRAITAWRGLNEQPHKALALTLRASGQGASVRFCVLMNDQESLNFAQLISIPFKAAGWMVGYRFESHIHGIMTGILLPEPQDNWLEEMKAVNERVRDAFMKAEISFVNGWPLEPYMYTDDNAPLVAPIAWVYVGPKPMPPLEYP